ncbi:DUF523 domain-containing protein [Kandleria sp.]|jgi:uncharacterized protein YbbK (DUF523 family)|uniref:DUF523 domain-containing protein n=1 Tax=Kandleria sp. TaxID=2774291 RepID=UPI001B40021A|nr:DUF523 domain-containing protein [Kandleria sp.]MBP3275310.1 DUF523 domain-containing protein [Kandleria sp.]
MIGISRCLVGDNCTYRGDSNLVEELEELKKEGAILVCPEVLGGLPIPRDPAEIVSESPLKVMTVNGKDVTKEYVEGARKAVDHLLENNVDTVIVKSNSPSCGAGTIYDGTYSHKKIKGDGIFVRLLRKHDIHVYTAEEYLLKRKGEK